MKAKHIFISVSAACLVVIGINTAAALAADTSTTVVVKKSVQNQTTNSEITNADTAATALAAKPGDILKYIVTITNNAEQADGNKNDFRYAKLIDALPAGINLISDSNKREVSEDIGTIKPGQTITKQFLVKVIATKDGDILENKACFTGQYEAKNQPQSDCESAFVKVTVPAETPQTPAPVTPVPQQPAPQTPAPQPQPSAPAPATPAAPAPANGNNLPTTGASELIGSFAAATVGGAAYVARMVHVRRRS